MKAYKAFNKDMTCRGFQFEEEKEYEEQNAVLCESGFHACENPLDCWDYYDMLNSNIHEVELDGVSDERNEDTKVCAKKIKIGVKMSLFDIVKASIEYVKNSVELNKKNDISKSDNLAQLASSGNWAKLASSGNLAKLASSGNLAKLASSGDSAKLASSGNWAQLASSGNWAKLASSGDLAKLASSGNLAKLASSGDLAKLASSGDLAKLASSGDLAKLASSGDSAKLASSGDQAIIKSTGKNSVIVCSGYDNKVSAKKGSWITLTEWEQNEEGDYIPVCVKTEQVDGVRIKEDVLYTIKNGEFVEVEED